MTADSLYLCLQKHEQEGPLPEGKLLLVLIHCLSRQQQQWLQLDYLLPAVCAAKLG